MVIDMNDVKLVTLEQLRGFLAGTSDLGLTSTADAATRYAFIKSVLKRFKYPLQSKAPRGLIRRYLVVDEKPRKARNHARFEAFFRGEDYQNDTVKRAFSNVATG